jgi:adenine deaminase
MSNSIDKYKISLELSEFLKKFSFKYQMVLSIEKISAEMILTLTPISRDTSANINADNLIKILLKNNIHFLRYYSMFSIPANYNYFKVTKKGLKPINITYDNTFIKYLRKRKIQKILNGK